MICASRGGLQTINQIPIQKGNNNLMETLVRVVGFRKLLGKRDGLKHTFGDDIGNGGWILDRASY